MIVYHRACQQYSNGAWSALTPLSISAETFTLSGTSIESLSASYDSSAERYYVQTTDVQYVSGQTYEIRWSVTLASGAYAVSDYFVHRQPSGAGSPPEAPTVRVLETHVGYATLYVAEPADPDDDYSHSIIYVTGRDGTFGSYTALPGEHVQVFGAAGVEHFATAVAVDSEGNKSAPSPVVTFVPLQGEGDSAGEMPITVRWYADEEGEHAFSPGYINTGRHGIQTIGSTLAPIARGRGLRVRLECRYPVHPKVRRIMLMFTAPVRRPPEGVHTKAKER
ncbi:hypothetical protein DRH29_05225 [candidate division Kazan bacterium]|uniref:Uncharacterized protein n=1 Tax=candidate division Kazan bacterium TaxID=2202143 RepID=A0A420ZBA0_UNCK3|nr:MAG: hypothetical protein DRH29_05225 [candidate division Kazan bacterium]